MARKEAISNFVKDNQFFTKEQEDRLVERVAGELGLNPEDDSSRYFCNDIGKAVVLASRFFGIPEPMLYVGSGRYKNKKGEKGIYLAKADVDEDGPYITIAKNYIEAHVKPAIEKTDKDYSLTTTRPAQLMVHECYHFYEMRHFSKNLNRDLDAADEDISNWSESRSDRTAEAFGIVFERAKNFHNQLLRDWLKDMFPEAKQVEDLLVSPTSRVEEAQGPYVSLLARSLPEATEI